MKKVVVLSVGGSLINPGRINLKFLKQLKQIILTRTEKFILVCGGGINARVYPAAARALSVKGSALDNIGIQATLLNAELLRHLFNAPEIQREPRKIKFKKVLIAGGWKPGCTSDYDTILWAKKYNSNTVVNLSNTDYVYTKDPSQPGARPLKKLTWNEYNKRFHLKHTAGMHTPFEPKAAKAAQEHKIKVLHINGNKLDNLKLTLANKNFIGTVIG
ncbi:UMP kinase [Candidatus Woesearchaeota archaeon]|nr:UMP kinase [Candidatus Woesearchaeota archaeon]